jgi:cytochrome c553
VKITAIAATFCALSAATLAAQSFPASTPPLFNPEFGNIPSPALIDTGREIAKGGAETGGVAMKCMACHGLEGQGSATGAIPRLAGLNANYLYDQLRAFRAGTRPAEIMGPIAHGLGEHEARAVTAYYASLAPTPLKELGEVEPELLQHGGALAAAGESLNADYPTACSQCHAAGGSLGSGVAPELAGQHGTYIAKQLRAWQAGERTNDPMGVMAQVAAQLSDRDIAAVAAYYERLDPAPPRAN